ncbi:AAA family ATPase [Spirosoma aerophilum]
MLKRVSIQNFKSLKDVTLDLQKINLLIGPNNSGKTNFLKALEFFKFAVLQDDVTAERQSRDFRFKRSFDNLSIELILERQDEEITFSREFVFSDPSSAVDVKSAQIIKKNGVELARYDQGYPDVTFLRQELNSLSIYRPDPNKLTKPGPVGTGEDIVNADASNLIGFLDRMLGNKYRKTVFNRIEEDLQICIPEFDEINIDDDASPTEELKRLFPNNSFKRLGLTNSKQGITYWADELSEGTLYFLALLCIINQPNPPKLLLLEEPEKGIHPRRIFEVIQFIFRLAEEKDVQVIMTTHSPLVVDMFKDMPESVFIFDKDDEGATHVKNLQHDVIEPETAKSKALGIEPPHYTDSLGDAWTVGFLGGVPK